MNITSEKWSGRMLKLAHQVASWSKDQSTKVGAFITTPDGTPLSWGYNGMARGIDDSIPERHERPTKYKWMCHAERNALDLAQTTVSGGIMFVTHSVCTACAQAIIQNRISTVVIDRNNSVYKMPPHWHEDMAIAVEMLEEAGVNIIHADPDPSV